MEILLYAEIYLICIIILSMVLYWTRRNEDESFSGIWFKALLLCFLVNFTSNFFFTLLRPMILESEVARIASFALKTIYHISLCIGVYTWCKYTAAELEDDLLLGKKVRRGALLRERPEGLHTFKEQRRW